MEGGGEKEKEKKEKKILRSGEEGLVYYAVRWSSVKLEYKTGGGAASFPISADCYAVIEIPKEE